MRTKPNFLYFNSSGSVQPVTTAKEKTNWKILAIAFSLEDNCSLKVSKNLKKKIPNSLQSYFCRSGLAVLRKKVVVFMLQKLYQDQLRTNFLLVSVQKISTSQTRQSLFDQSWKDSMECFKELKSNRHILFYPITTELNANRNTSPNELDFDHIPSARMRKSGRDRSVRSMQLHERHHNPCVWCGNPWKIIVHREKKLRQQLFPARMRRSKPRPISQRDQNLMILLCSIKLLWKSERVYIYTKEYSTAKNH